MFDFKKKRLNPLLKQFVEKINGAMPVNTPDQSISLLGVKKEITERFGKLAKAEGSKAATLGFTTIAVAAGLAVVAFLAPTAAIAAAGGAVAVLLGGGLMAQKCALNKGVVTRDRFILTDKIDTEVALAVTRMSGSYLTPELKTALGQAFTDATNKKEYDALAKHAMKFVPPQPKAAVAAPAAK